MRLFYDLDQNRLIRGLHSPVSLPGNRVEIKVASEPVEFVFVRPLVEVEELDEPTVLVFGLKETGEHAADFIASNWNGTEYAHNLTDSVYSLTLAWDVASLAELFATAAAANIPRDYVDLAAELRSSAAGSVRKSLPFYFRVYASYITGSEGVPLTANPDYPTPPEIELIARKGVANGYAPLDGDGFLPAAHIPSSIGAHPARTDNPHAVTKAQIGLAAVDNTSDAGKPISTATATALADKADLIAGKVATSQLPALSITEFLGSVASQVAMLALAGQSGDWCNRSDTSTAWVIIGADPAQLSSWAQINYPAAPVLSVNGQAGVVTLGKSDVGLGNVNNTADAGKPVSTAQQTALNLKANASIAVNGGGLAIGGGLLTETRTITVEIAPQAFAEEGTNNTTGMTPLRTAQAIAALGASPTVVSYTYFVDPYIGNDATGAVGNPAKPYLTATAAYNVGVAVGSDFILELSQGGHTLNVNTADFSPRCTSINGRGKNAAATNLVFFSQPALAINNAGSNGWNGTVWLSNLTLYFAVTGGFVQVTDEAPYNAGNAGIWTVNLANCLISSVIGAGGGDAGSINGYVNGGSGATIMLYGSAEATGSITTAGGSTYGGAPGSEGTLLFDGIDLRQATVANYNGLTVGRCSYTTGLAITADKGGNAAY